MDVLIHVLRLFHTTILDENIIYPMESLVAKVVCRAADGKPVCFAYQMMVDIVGWEGRVTTEGWLFLSKHLYFSSVEYVFPSSQDYVLAWGFAQTMPKWWCAGT